MSQDQMERLRQQGLERIWKNEPEAALPLFDQALALCEDEGAKELIRINKALALIVLERFDTPEVRALPRIVLRRGIPRHTYLASNQLARRFRLEQNLERARHYARIAVEVTEQMDNDSARASALTELGNIEIFDSRFGSAIPIYEEVLSLLPTEGSDTKRYIILQNLGYAKLLSGQVREGVEMIHEALDLVEPTGETGFAAESYIDLCHGYLELGDLDQARHFGELGLKHFFDSRQERNVHYLMGEIAHKSGDFSAAEHHFNHLARHYPDFPQLKDLLLAVDLRTMINWKLS